MSGTICCEAAPIHLAALIIGAAIRHDGAAEACGADFGAVEHCTAQIGQIEVSLVEVGAGEVSLGQDGSCERRFCEVRAGQVVLAVGNHDGASLAALGIVALAGGAWHSLRGGTIDSLIRLDLALSPAAEGGALVDLKGRVIGMTVLGPRSRALSIPSSTVERAVDQLLARGHVFRGYLGAGLQRIRQERANGSQSSGSRRGVLVVSIDPNGPSARAGILVGDIVTAWNGKPIERVREIMRLLGPESVGITVDLALIRGGAPTTLRVVIGERPVA